MTIREEAQKELEKQKEAWRNEEMKKCLIALEAENIRHDEAVKKIEDRIYELETKKVVVSHYISVEGQSYPIDFTLK